MRNLSQFSPRVYVLFTVAVVSVVSVGWWSFQGPQVDRTRVWRVGTDNTLPYHALEVDSAGASVPRGIAAELMAHAARRVGIRLSWQVADVSALEAGQVDLWPTNSFTTTSPGIRVTRPFMRHSFVSVSRRPIEEGPDGKPRVGRLILRNGRLTPEIQNLYPNSEIVLRPERSMALASLCAGQADTLLMEARPLQALLLNRPAVCDHIELHVSGSLMKPRELGFGSTLEAATVANLLRLEVDKMIEDGAVNQALKSWAYYSSGDVDLIYREAAASREHELAMSLVCVLVVLAMALFWLFVQARQAQREAIAANQSKTQFLANISHEIRTPLNGILGLAEVLSSSSLDARQREILGSLASSGKNLLCIVNDVLDLARVVRGQFELKPEPVELGHLFKEAAGPFTLAASNKQLAFDMQGLDRLPQLVLADPVRLRQIFINLVGNAIKFTDAGSVRVRFAIWMEPNTPESSCLLHLEVADTGIGISQEGRRNLFEKFHQADASISRRFGGTGLGLSIVKEIVQSMGGKIDFESRAGVGSCFKVTVPVTRLEAAPVEYAAPQPEAASASNAERLHILVVEDNQVNQMVVQSFLEMAGHEVVCEADGESGVQAWQRGGFDLILMDCQMPHMDGYQATAMIRAAEPARARTPIIALTASAMIGEREQCLAAGMNDFLSKPISAADLYRVVNAWAEHSPRRISKTS